MRFGLASRFGRLRQPPLSRRNPAKNRSLSEFEVDNWAISDFVVRVLVPAVGSHPFPLHELMLMVATVCRFEPPEIFEWGTHVGKSARVFAESTAHYGIKTEVHSTDLPDDARHAEHPGGERGVFVRDTPRVHLHQGDGLEVSLRLWRSTGRKAHPLFFLDGDHAFESVRRELNGIMTEVPDAILLVHDSFHQAADSGYNVGPREAIEAALVAHPDRYRVVESGLGLPGLTLLYPAPV
jgi:cephalosporin hydroxylase